MTKCNKSEEEIEYFFYILNLKTGHILEKY